MVRCAVCWARLTRQHQGAGTRPTRGRTAYGSTLPRTTSASPRLVLLHAWTIADFQEAATGLSPHPNAIELWNAAVFKRVIGELSHPL
jgi:hypothetical protein